MRYLTLVDGSDHTPSTADLVRYCAVTVGERAMTADDVRRRIRILDALDVANGVLALEDQDHALLAQIASGPIWRPAGTDPVAVLRAVVVFTTAVAAAPKERSDG